MKPPNFSDWPPWARAAHAAMLATGIPPEVILTRALLLGFKPEPFVQGTVGGNVHSRYVEWIWRRADNTGGLLGITAEMLAYRFLVWEYPHALKNTS